MACNNQLQYKISDWHHLVNCKSNNSSKLHISVSDIVDDNHLQCLLIQIIHTNYGVVFATTLKAFGHIISNSTYLDNHSYEPTPAQIIEELNKWGFNVIYDPSKTLPSDMISLLITVNKLGYDKIRVLGVSRMLNGAKQVKSRVVCFNVKDNPHWLNASYEAREKEYMNALVKGTAFTVSSLSEAKGLDWSWLYGWVGSIDDILQENAEVSE